MYTIVTTPEYHGSTGQKPIYKLIYSSYVFYNKIRVRCYIFPMRLRYRRRIFISAVPLKTITGSSRFGRGKKKHCTHGHQNYTSRPLLTPTFSIRRATHMVFFSVRAQRLLRDKLIIHRIVVVCALVSACGLSGFSLSTTGGRTAGRQGEFRNYLKTGNQSY